MDLSADLRSPLPGVLEMEIKEIASLVLEGDSYDQDPIPLSPSGITSIGRLLDNDVVVSEVGVSRFHSEIIETEDGYYLRDMGSTNGTFLNECRLAEGNQELQDDDTINHAGPDPRSRRRMPPKSRCPSGARAGEDG